MGGLSLIEKYRSGVQKSDAAIQRKRWGGKELGMKGKKDAPKREGKRTQGVGFVTLKGFQQGRQRFHLWGRKRIPRPYIL